MLLHELDVCALPDRAIGQATEQIIMGNATAASLFSTALYQSFSEQYQIFNLLCTFGAVLPAVSAPITPVGGELCSCCPQEDLSMMCFVTAGNILPPPGLNLWQ